MKGLWGQWDMRLGNVWGLRGLVWGLHCLQASLACAGLHGLQELFFLARLGGNVHPHIVQKPSPEVSCSANGSGCWLFGWAKRGDSSKKKTEPIYTALAGGKSLIFHPAITELISLRLRAVDINCQGIFTVGNARHGLLLEAESWTRSSSPCSGRGEKESIANSKPISPSILLPAEKGRKASRLLYWPFSRKCSGLKVSGVSHTFLSNIIEVRLVITVVPCKRWRKQEFAWGRRADVLSD